MTWFLPCSWCVVASVPRVGHHGHAIHHCPVHSHRRQPSSRPCCWGLGGWDYAKLLARIVVGMVGCSADAVTSLPCRFVCLWFTRMLRLPTAYLRFRRSTSIVAAHSRAVCAGPMLHVSNRCDVPTSPPMTHTMWPTLSLSLTAASTSTQLAVLPPLQVIEEQLLEEALEMSMREDVMPSDASASASASAAAPAPATPSSPAASRDNVGVPTGTTMRVPAVSLCRLCARFFFSFLAHSGGVLCVLHHFSLLALVCFLFCFVLFGCCFDAGR